MNVIFHTTTAIAVAVLLTDTKKNELLKNSKAIFQVGILAFIVGIVSHGALDYIPHCYPINSKVDVIIGLLMILITICFINKKYRLIMTLAFLGCIFPDLVDLSPQILNKQFGTNLPIMEKIFPWHLHRFSGSIYNDNCEISTLNHILLSLTICIVCWCRRVDLQTMFNREF
jgi:hypothetical protein